MLQSTSLSLFSIILCVFSTFAKARPSPMDGLYFATRPIHPHNPGNGHHPAVIPKPYYNYGYSVLDEYSGNNYNAQETADGKYQSTN